MAAKTRTRRRPLSLADVRELALSLPEVEETTAYGMPAFKAGKTRFAGQPIERADVEPNSLGVRVSFEERERRLTARPDLYYLTEHFASYPAVLARLTNMRREELAELLGTAWRYAMEAQPPPKKKRKRRAAR
ncbi:MAG TPA: hypothetical protein VM692_02690 [Gammaproteobacteria bacterium]|nr:hypothetical protein [Gammaproteobacteria bacterium]